MVKRVVSAFFMGIITLLIVLIAACSENGNGGLQAVAVSDLTTIAPTQTPMTAPAPEPTVYVYSKANYTDIFTNHYMEAQKQIQEKRPDIPDAPVSPKETGFAVVPLDGEVYGVDAFAFLPLAERSLTEQEMMQLARAMGGLSAEQVLEPAHSYLGFDTGKTDNRPYTWEESVRAIWLYPQYFYAGLMPQNALSNDPDEGGPICVEIGEWEKYFILPTAAMTDEQLLQIIHRRYEHVDKELFRPLPEQIQYEQAGDAALELLEQLGLAREGEVEILAYYFSTTRVGESLSPGHRLSGVPDRWTVRFHYPDPQVAEYDYEIILNADDGSFSEWSLIPYGSFSLTPPETSQFDPEKGKDVECDRDELKGIAEEYVRDMFFVEGESVTGIGADFDDSSSYFGACVRVNIETSGGGKYAVYVLKDDLTIYRVIAS